MQYGQQRTHRFDELDDRILEALVHDPNLSNRALADRVRASESTCAYRVRRLRDTGAIKSRQLQLDHSRLGYSLHAVVLVFLTRHSREVVDDFMDHMTRQPHVLSVMNLTGRYDFMVTIAVEDAEHLRDFVLDHVTILPTVRSVETHIVSSMRDGRWIPKPSRGNR